MAQSRPIDGPPEPKPLTGIREVARLAGVSIGTVSNVLNRPERVSTATRDNVRAVIERVQFVPNAGAADLRRGRSRMLGLVVPDMTNPFFADVARGAVDVAEEHGRVAVLCDSNSDASREAHYLDAMEEQRVAGLLVTPMTSLEGRIEQLRARRIHVVLVDQAGPVSQVCSVSVDDVSGAEMAVRHLLDTGATTVALVNGDPRMRQCIERREGARRAIAKAGLPESALHEVRAPSMSVAAGVDAARDLITRPLQAVFCTNDLLAIGVVRHLEASGVRVPDDVSVVGYDDIDRAADIPIPLTSVARPKYDLGRAACELLIKEITEISGQSDRSGHLKSRRHRHERIVFTPSLVTRQTTRPTPA